MVPLQQPQTPMLLGLSVVKEIFFQIPELHLWHKNFLTQVKERVENWHSMGKIGDLFVASVSRMCGVCVVKLGCFLSTVFREQTNGDILQIHQQFHAGQKQHSDSQNAAPDVCQISGGRFLFFCTYKKLHFLLLL